MEGVIDKLVDSHIVSVTPTTKSSTALKLLQDSNLSIMPVLNDGVLVGIVSEEELKGRPGGEVKGIMRKPLYIEMGKSIDYAIKYIMRNNIDRVPVVESSMGMRCIGTISSSALLKEKRSMK